jgi:hypothetical protein
MYINFEVWRQDFEEDTTPRNTVGTLTIESVHNFIVTNVIPRLATTWQQSEMMGTSSSNGVKTVLNELDGNATAIGNAFPKAHRLESMSLTTTWRWMCLLGFQYDTRKKSFYVDGHERDEFVATCSTFCKRYLTDYKPYCNRWVQRSVHEAKTIKDLNPEFGYSYFDIVSNQD